MSGETPAFVDTNILVYAFNSTDPTRQRSAALLLSRLMDEDRLRLSTQVLQEFYVTMTRKAGLRGLPSAGSQSSMTSLPGR